MATAIENLKKHAVRKLGSLPIVYVRELTYTKWGVEYQYEDAYSYYIDLAKIPDNFGQGDDDYRGQLRLLRNAINGKLNMSCIERNSLYNEHDMWAGFETPNCTDRKVVAIEVEVVLI